MNNAPCSFDGNTVIIAPRVRDGRMSYVLKVLEKGGQSSGKGAGSNTTEVWWEPMQLGRWTDFVINFSLSSNKQGFVNVWRNGQLIYSKSGLTNVNTHDSCGKPIPADQHSSLGPSVGIYGPGCGAGTLSSHYREVLFDELRTACGRAQWVRRRRARVQRRGRRIGYWRRHGQWDHERARSGVEL